MNEEKQAVEPASASDCAARLVNAAEALERVIGKLAAQYEAINQKVDRIVATVDKTAAAQAMQTTVESQAASGRKTVAPLVATLLAKSGMNADAQWEKGALDRALASLTIEQRMAVKAELARAGWIA